MLVIPVSWDHRLAASTLVAAAACDFNSSLTKWLDQNGFKIEGPRAMISVLHEFVGSTYLQRPLLLRHIYFGYLILADRTTHLEILKNYASVLEITPSEDFDLLYVSGSLLRLKEMVVNPINPKVRKICNLIYEHIYGLGLEAVFSDYGKTDQRDGTFILQRMLV